MRRAADGGQGRVTSDLPLNICDQCDPLRSKRPYKPAFSHERSVQIITVRDGRTLPSHYDPAALACLEVGVGSFATSSTRTRMTAACELLSAGCLGERARRMHAHSVTEA
jgi:hypothetical protein